MKILMAALFLMFYIPAHAQDTVGQIGQIGQIGPIQCYLGGTSPIEVRVIVGPENSARLADRGRCREEKE
jgi:hypothetical protein